MEGVMKTMTIGLSVMLMLLSGQASATALISNGNYGDSYTVGSYTVYDYHQTSDAWDGSSGYTGNFTGLYIGTVDDNNDNPTVLTYFLYYLNASNIYDFGTKVDAPAFSSADGNLKITYNGTIGTWTLLNGYETIFYSVKGGTSYALYYVNPAESSGDWTSAHLEPNKQGTPASISHLTVAKDPSLVVPEPTTMLLFGAGIAGLAGIARRKRS
jgi:hypothetical protein